MFVFEISGQVIRLFYLYLYCRYIWFVVDMWGDMWGIQ